MSNQMTLPGIDSAISLRDLEAGQQLFNSQTGQMRLPFGRDHAPASHSVPQESSKPIETNGTCGPSSATLSEPVDRASSSESKSPAQRSSELSKAIGQRLQEMLPSGSMEYRQTWKLRATPLGRQFWAHIASSHRISGNDCSGWPTVTTSEERPETILARRQRLRDQGRSRDVMGMTLGAVAQMAGWPTATTRDHKDTPGMATEAINPDGTSRNRMDRIGLLVGYPTPNTSPEAPNGSTTRENGQQRARQTEQCLGAIAAAISGATVESSPAETEKPGVLDPQLPCWLMGYPVAWLLCAPAKKPTRTAEPEP